MFMDQIIRAGGSEWTTLPIQCLTYGLIQLTNGLNSRPADGGNWNRVWNCGVAGVERGHLELIQTGAAFIRGINIEGTIPRLSRGITVDHHVLARLAGFKDYGLLLSYANGVTNSKLHTLESVDYTGRDITAVVFYKNEVSFNIRIRDLQKPLKDVIEHGGETPYSLDLSVDLGSMSIPEVANPFQSLNHFLSFLLKQFASDLLRKRPVRKETPGVELARRQDGTKQHSYLTLPKNIFTGDNMVKFFKRTDLAKYMGTFFLTGKGNCYWTVLNNYFPLKVKSKGQGNEGYFSMRYYRLWHNLIDYLNTRNREEDTKTIREAVAKEFQRRFYWCPRAQYDRPWYTKPKGYSRKGALLHPVDLKNDMPSLALVCRADKYCAFEAAFNRFVEEQDSNLVNVARSDILSEVESDKSDESGSAGSETDHINYSDDE